MGHHTRADRLSGVERVFATLMVVTASSMAFAHGSNDVANAIGPLAAIVGVTSTGEVLQKALQQAVKDAKDAREASAKQSREDQDRRKVEVLGAKTSKVPVALKGKENDMQPA